MGDWFNTELLINIYAIHEANLLSSHKLTSSYARLATCSNWQTNLS